MDEDSDAPAPLDRAAAVLYGRFVVATYQMYNEAKDTLTPPVPAGANAIPPGWELTAWIQMSDFAFGGERVPSFYAILVRNLADPYSHLLAVRGTEGLVEWYDDAICLPKAFTPVPKAGDVSAGFDNIYATLRVIRAPRPAEPGTMQGRDVTQPQAMQSKTFADQIEELLGTIPVPHDRIPPHGGERKHHLIVTGHSLGAALCTLYTMEHAIKKKADPTRKVTIDRVCTFASPRVGMQSFVDQFDALPIDKWRIANDQDIVPKVPPTIAMILPYHHVDTLYSFTSEGMTKFNPSCWHAMETYLHWLDETIALDPKCAL